MRTLETMATGRVRVASEGTSVGLDDTSVVGTAVGRLVKTGLGPQSWHHGPEAGSADSGAVVTSQPETENIKLTLAPGDTLFPQEHKSWLKEVACRNIPHKLTAERTSHESKGLRMNEKASDNAG